MHRTVEQIAKKSEIIFTHSTKKKGAMTYQWYTERSWNKKIHTRYSLAI